MATLRKFEVEVFYRLPKNPAFIGASLVSNVSVWADDPAEARAFALDIAGFGHNEDIETTVAGVRALDLYR